MEQDLRTNKVEGFFFFEVGSRIDILMPSFILIHWYFSVLSEHLKRQRSVHMISYHSQRKC